GRSRYAPLGSWMERERQDDVQVQDLEAADQFASLIVDWVSCGHPVRLHRHLIRRRARTPLAIFELTKWEESAPASCYQGIRSIQWKLPPKQWLRPRWRLRTATRFRCSASACGRSPMGRRPSTPCAGRWSSATDILIPPRS